MRKKCGRRLTLVHRHPFAAIQQHSCASVARHGDAALDDEDIGSLQAIGLKASEIKRRMK